MSTIRSLHEYKRGGHGEHAPAATDREIAAHLGISEGRVMQLRNRAYRKIREMVQEDPDLAEFVSELCGFDVTEKRSP